MKVFGSFSKSQASALTAGLVDFSTLMLLVEWARIDYRWAVGFAALAGALWNFSLNRIWAFGAHNRLPIAIGRYGLISLGSLFWNVALVWFIVEVFAISYFAAKVVVSILVALAWNYPLHKFWVFAADLSQVGVSHEKAKTSH